MKKIKYIILAAVLIVAGIYLGCEIPDYSLGFEITQVAWDYPNPGQVTVDYYMENIGYEDLYSAQIRFEYGSDNGYDYEWTWPVDLSVGETDTDTMVFDYIAGSDPSFEYVYITGSAWDTEDSTW